MNSIFGYEDCIVSVKCRHGHITNWTCFNKPTDENLRLEIIQDRLKSDTPPCSQCYLEFGKSYEVGHKVELLKVSDINADINDNDSEPKTPIQESLF